MKVKELRKMLKGMKGDDLVLFEIPKSNGDCEELVIVDVDYGVLGDKDGEKPSVELMMDYKEEEE